MDLILRGNIADYVAVYLGHETWRELAGKILRIEGDRRIAKQFPVWLQIDNTNALEAAV